MEQPLSSDGRPRLGEFLRTRRAAILEDWHRRVQSLPPAQGLSIDELINHLPALFDRIAGMVEDLEAGRPVGDAGGPSELHTLDRLNEGYGLAQVVQEFASLRDSVLSLWANERLHAASQLVLNRAIDEAVCIAVSRFSAARERTIIALDRIAEATLDSPDLGGLLNALTRILLETTASVDSVTIYLREGDRLHLRAAVGIEAPLVNRMSVEIGSDTCAGRIAATLVHLEWRDAAHEPLATAPIRASGARALYGVPMMHHGELVGVSHICSRSAFEFSREDKLLFRSMVERATVAIAHWQLHDALRESEERFRTLADHIAQFAWMADESGWIFWYNRRWFDYTGTTLEQMRGWGWRQVHHPDHLHRVEATFRRALETGEPWEDTFPLRGRDGQYRWFLSRALPIRDKRTGRIHRWFGTNTDITEQKLAEEARAAAVERERVAHRQTERTAAMLDALFAGLPLGLAFFDRECRYLRVNETLAVLNGRSAAEHVGKTVREVLPQSAGELEPLLRQVWTSGEALLGVEVSLAPPVTPEDVHDWQMFFFPVNLPDGTRAGVGAAVVDVTVLKRALKARDEFLSVASHDLKSPLAALRLLVESIARKAVAGPDRVDWPWIQRKLEKATRQTRRLTAMLDNLLDVSRIDSGQISLELEDVDLAALVRDVATRHLEILANSGCALQLDAPGHVVGQWDALRLEQIVSNLLSNAAKYGAGHPVDVHLTASADSATLTVRDQGVGITREDQERLFKRFERVGDRKAFAGTGVGLWIVHSFIEAMGGTIQVESELGQGALFRVELPRRTG